MKKSLGYPHELTQDEFDSTKMDVEQVDISGGQIFTATEINHIMTTHPLYKGIDNLASAPTTTGSWSVINGSRSVRDHAKAMLFMYFTDRYLSIDTDGDIFFHSHPFSAAYGESWYIYISYEIRSKYKNLRNIDAPDEARPHQVHLPRLARAIAIVENNLSSGGT